MAKGKNIFNIILTGVLLGGAYAFNYANKQRNAFKFLRIGLASANRFKYRTEHNSLEFDLVLSIDNLASFDLTIDDFVGKALLKDKELGYISTPGPINIRPKSNTKQTVKLSVPVPALVKVVGLSLFQLLNKKASSKLIGFVQIEGIATMKNTKIAVKHELSI
jgi:hypothetical protein